jgi:hypothetical protein
VVASDLGLSEAAVRDQIAWVLDKVRAKPLGMSIVSMTDGRV